MIWIVGYLFVGFVVWLIGTFLDSISKPFDRFAWQRVVEGLIWPVCVAILMAYLLLFFLIEIVTPLIDKWYDVGRR